MSFWFFKGGFFGDSGLWVLTVSRTVLDKWFLGLWTEMVLRDLDGCSGLWTLTVFLRTVTVGCSKDFGFILVFSRILKRKLIDTGFGISLGIGR
jgi:hypothetical protein